MDAPPLELDRRELMRLLASGASLAGLGGLAGCMDRPRERILPRTELAPELRPGVPVEYATSMVIDGYATGLLVKSLEGRPIKIEGNPDHPSSLGSTSAIHQASLLELYEPGRAVGAANRGLPVAPEAILRPLARQERMPGLWFVMYPQSSPLVASLIDRVRERHPGARFVFHTPLDRRAVHQGAALAFGRPLEPLFRFDQADVVVSLDADFLDGMPGAVRWSREFAARRRRIASPDLDPGRLYVAEPGPSPTGSLADHRAAASPSEVTAMAAALLAELVRLGAVSGVPGPVIGAIRRAAPPPRHRAWIAAAAADLAARRGRGLVVVGERQSAAVHALAHVINEGIGAPGRTLDFIRSPLIDPLGATLADLAQAARAGDVQSLVIVEANPVYTAPAELELAALLAAIPQTLHVAQRPDETAAACRSSLTHAHYLETWGDARAHDGTVSMIQPLIRPLYEGLSTPELLAVFAGEERPDGYRLLRQQHGAPPVASAPAPTWDQLVRLGLIPGSAPAPETARVTWSQPLAAALIQAVGAAAPRRSADALELALARSSSVYDGRYAAVSWLQELPRPITKLTWDNAALVSPATARLLGLESGQVARLTVAGRSVEAPVMVVPVQADGAVTLELGYGRRLAGAPARAVGVDAYPLRVGGRNLVAGLELTPTGRRHRLATTQEHWSMDRRAIALHATLEGYRREPDFTAELRGDLPSWLPDLLGGAPQWGMTIDTSICSGCSACVVACQAENNIPVVGREGVLRHREMHWLRIDTYLTDSGAEPPMVVHQPMLCQHCEKAPCEYVCPVYATQHSPDGLNEMVYNRCIGTRFCSNNCPYKVRRFNWFDYTEDAPETVQLARNPNVTVRARGVMEKCTFCVQRIRSAEIEARMEERAIAPGEVVTACQQACPTRAIQFGQLHHEETAVVQWRQEPRRYEVLHELGTRPRVVYLARIVNLHPDLARGSGEPSGG